MFNIMDNIIKSIRSWFYSAPPETRKRRCVYDDDRMDNKIRKMSNPVEDRWISTRNVNSLHVKSRPSWAKENLTINLDDKDDDIVESKHKSWLNNSKKSLSSPRFASTPTDNLTKLVQNGDDDVKLVSYHNSVTDKKNAAKQQSFEYIKPSSHINLNRNGTRNKDFISPIFAFGETKSSVSRKPLQNSALNQSFRLEEKEKYKELLEKVTANCNPVMTLASNLNRYYTPRESSSRARNLINLSRQQTPKEKSLEFIDLTKTDMTKKVNGARPRLSTKEKFQKILHHFDNNDSIIVKDSDSDSVEIVRSSPEPEPDFKVDPVNSLKHIIDTAEPAHTNWLNETRQRRRDETEKRQNYIENYHIHAQQLSAINRDIRIKTLEEKVKKCMQIKEDIVVASEVFDEETEFPSLTEQHKLIIANAFNARASQNEILVKKFGLNITRRDIMTLAGLNWLNDEVINFYMNLLIERGKDPKRPNVHALNTFFYPKLMKEGPESLMRWTRRIDVFAQDLLVVPIHLGMHWCMAIVDFRDKTIKYYDSMGSRNSRCLQALREYIAVEHMDKKKCEYDVSDWELENVTDIPHQMNGSDCGMFSCTFAEFLTRNAKITFSQEDMPYLRQKMVIEILTGELLIK